MRRAILVIAIAVGLAVSGAIGLARDDTPGERAAQVGAVVGSSVEDLQARLDRQPHDARSWAALGIAYVDQARLTGDPTLYDKAATALRHSRVEQPRDNDAALAGSAALAAARHDFGKALRLAQQALRINPFQAGALAIRVDALTELGRYDAQLRALSIADRRQPGVPVLARMSYAHELRGDLATAARLLQQGLGPVLGRADRAFLLTQLAELDRRSRRPGAAARHLTAAGRADPDYVPAWASQARLAVARGNLRAAEEWWLKATTRLPIPEYVVELGELYLATGRPTLARQQFGVVRAARELNEYGGVRTDIELAQFEADHGSAADAVAAAAAEWSRRRSVHVADGLAWAMHANGRSRTALPYAVAATRLGTPEASFWLHRGLIEVALERDADAIRHLRRGLNTDPGVSPWLAGQARAALTRLGTTS